MNKHQITVFLFSLLLALAQSGQAQNKKTPLTLENAISQATENNRSIKLAQQRTEVAKYNYQKTTSTFLPKINLSEVGIQTDDPLYAFGFLLQQRSVQASDFNPDQLNNPGKTVNWQTQVAVEQPLFNMDGIYGRKAASYQVQAHKKNEHRTVQMIQYHVKEAYFAFQLSSKQKVVISQALKTTEEVLRVTQDKHDEGYVNEADLLKVKVRKLELQNQLIGAEANEQNANDQLSYLITGSTGSYYHTVDTITIIMKEEAKTVSADRADLQALKLTAKAYQMQTKMSRSKFAPRINAFGQYNLNDTQIFGSQANSYFAGVSLNWSLFNGGSNLADAKKANSMWVKTTMELEKTKSEANLTLEQTNRAIGLSKNRLDVLQLTIQQSQEAYKLTHNLFLEGSESIENLLSVETMLSQKKLEYQLALYQHYIALSNQELQSK